MHLRNRVFLFACTLCIAFGATSATAAPIRYLASGVLYDVADPFDVLGGQLTVGMPFEGSFTYDPAASPISITTTVKASGTTTTVARYEWSPSGNRFALSMSVGGIGAQSDPAGFSRVNILHSEGRNRTHDLLQALTMNVTSTGALVGALEIVLDDRTRSVFSNPVLPYTLNLDDFDVNHFGMLVMGRGGNMAVVLGDIQSLTANPEPGTATLVFLGLTGLSMIRRSLASTPRRRLLRI